MLGYPQGVRLQVNCVAGWISCQRRIFETLVFSLQPPSAQADASRTNKFGANGKSPLKWTEDNSLVTINPPCYRLIV
jgi:hypothetical protein